MDIFMNILRNNRYFVIVMVLLIYLASRKCLYSENDTWIMPVEGVITQEFKGDLHHGIDINLTMGEPVKASHNGIILFTGEKGVYGNAVMISHDNDIVTLYGHNSKILVKVNDVVKQGDMIALGGSSGKSSAPHCHWEIRVHNICVNPIDYAKCQVGGIINESENSPNFNTNAYLPQDINKFEGN